MRLAHERAEPLSALSKAWWPPAPLFLLKPWSCRCRFASVWSQFLGALALFSADGLSQTPNKRLGIAQIRCVKALGELVINW